MAKVIALHHYDKWEGYDQNPYSFMPAKEEFITKDKTGKLVPTDKGLEKAEFILGRPIDAKHTVFLEENIESNLELLKAKIRNAERMITILYNSRA